MIHSVVESEANTLNLKVKFMAPNSSKRPVECIYLESVDRKRCYFQRAPCTTAARYPNPNPKDWIPKTFTCLGKGNYTGTLDEY